MIKSRNIKSRASNVIGVRGKRDTVTIGYVVIPGNVKRSDYVADCYRRNMVSIQFDSGGYYMDVPVEVNVMKSIVFPDDYREFGSCVVCVNEYNHNKPIVIGILLKGNEVSDYSENEFRLERHTNDGSVCISGKGNDGNLFVTVSGKTSKNGKIYINVLNEVGSGEIILNINGDFKAELNNIVLNILSGMDMAVKNDINVDFNRLNLGATDSVQAVLKGDDSIEQLKKELKAMTDLLNSISNITPSVVPANAVDPTWVAWKSVVASITDRGNYDNIQSEKVFIE